MNPQAPPRKVVDAFFQAMASGDVVEARSIWDQQAVWHLTGSHELARDYTRNEYFEMLGTWHAAYPDYKADRKETRDFGGEVAVVHMESTQGMAPGRASGLLIYRVVGGSIREGWAIPTFESGRYPF